MSIKTAIDNLTGKSSKNIEDAISKMELGGGSTIIHLTKKSDYGGNPSVYLSDLSYAEMVEKVKQGPMYAHYILKEGDLVFMAGTSVVQYATGTLRVDINGAGYIWVDGDTYFHQV